MVSGRVGARGGVLCVLSVIVVGVSACGGSGGGEVAASASPSAASSSVPVPAGVAKDSVLDLNSTKDMTGVVTTVPIGESPYDENMPDICPFIPQAALDELGLGSKKKAFFGPKLLTQSCQLTPAGSAANDKIIAVTLYVNNFSELLSGPRLKPVGQKVIISDRVVATVAKSDNFTSSSDTFQCEVVWGTFFGSAAVSIIDFKSGQNICDRATVTASLLSAAVPRRPSEMRPTS